MRVLMFSNRFFIYAMTAWVFLLPSLLQSGAVLADPAAAPAPSESQVSTQGLPVEEVISAEDLRKMQLENRNFLLFDARSKKSYDLAHIKGAILPLPTEYYRQMDLYLAKIVMVSPDSDKALKEATASYAPDMEIVTYCNKNCGASAHLLIQLKRLGFTRVKAMVEGIDVWMDRGYPVAIGTPRLSSDALQG